MRVAHADPQLAAAADAKPSGVASTIARPSSATPSIGASAELEPAGDLEAGASPMHGGVPHGTSVSPSSRV